jgi:hypothetical protein
MLNIDAVGGDDEECCLSGYTDVVWWKFAYVAMNPAPIFGLDGGNSRFIPDVCKYMQGYKAPHFTRQNSSNGG